MIATTKSRTPTIRFSDQCFWGFYLALASSFGIMGKSWGTFSVLLLFGLFCFLPTFAARCWKMDSPRNAWKVAALAFAAAFVLTLLWSGATVAERLYYLHGASYPSWLSSGDIGEVGPFPYVQDAKINQLCAGRGPQAITRKAGDQVVLRCDDMAFWPNTKTYIGHTTGN